MDSLLQITHYIPILSTIISFAFAAVLYRHWQKRKTADYLLWWCIGVFMFGVGTLTEAATALLPGGWNDFILKSWYITGALMGGAPLAHCCRCCRCLCPQQPPLHLCRSRHQRPLATVAGHGWMAGHPGQRRPSRPAPPLHPASPSADTGATKCIRPRTGRRELDALVLCKAKHCTALC